MSAKPIIGISCSFDYETDNSLIKEGYYMAVLKAGGLPVTIPAIEDEEYLNEIIMRFDGVLLSGGPDLDARIYRECNLPFNGKISPVRDSMEIYIARKAANLNKPLLGICRGIQVINAALGGTVYQDIASQVVDCQTLKHSQQAPTWYPVHDIYIEKGSRAASWFASNPAGVNSFHHQAVKDVAPGFVITARTEDGIIEAIESRENSFIVGVQWHPEVMWQQNPELLNVFTDFVNFCGKKV